MTKEAQGELVVFSDSETEQINKLRKLMLDHAVRTLQWWWDVGEAVMPIYYGAEQKQAGAGRERIRAVSAALQLPNDRCLMDAMYIVERWKDRSRYEALIAACTSKTGQVLSISHIKELSRVNDDKVVFAEAKAAVENNMSCAALRQRLSKKFAGKKGKKRGPGRKPLIPTNMEACLLSIEKEAKRLRRMIKEAWCGDQYNIIDAIRNVSREVSDMTDENGVQLTDRLDAVYQLLSDALDDFNQFVKSYTLAMNKLDTALYDKLNEAKWSEDDDEEESTD